jgi:rhodanese-related sulfurtransferase
MHVFVGDLSGRIATLPSAGELWTACTSGHRASIAASLLDRAGLPVKLVARGGVADWLAECGPSSTSGASANRLR